MLSTSRSGHQTEQSCYQENLKLQLLFNLCKVIAVSEVFLMSYEVENCTIPDINTFWTLGLIAITFWVYLS